MTRGLISFYKDGQDLGLAFKIQEGIELHPFIQFNESCSLQVFHPEVFPEVEMSSPSEKVQSELSSSVSCENKAILIKDQEERSTIEFRLKILEESQKLKY